MHAQEIQIINGFVFHPAALPPPRKSTRGRGRPAVDPAARALQGARQGFRPIAPQPPYRDPALNEYGQRKVMGSFLVGTEAYRQTEAELRTTVPNSNLAWITGMLAQQPGAPSVRFYRIGRDAQAPGGQRSVSMPAMSTASLARHTSVPGKSFISRAGSSQPGATQAMAQVLHARGKTIGPVAGTSHRVARHQTVGPYDGDTTESEDTDIEQTDAADAESEDRVLPNKREAAKPLIVSATGYSGTNSEEGEILKVGRILFETVESVVEDKPEPDEKVKMESAGSTGPGDDEEEMEFRGQGEGFFSDRRLAYCLKE